MKEFGVQLYSVRDTMHDAQSIRNTFRKLREMGYTRPRPPAARSPMPNLAALPGKKDCRSSEPTIPLTRCTRISKPRWQITGR